jgi:guanylate kinase
MIARRLEHARDEMEAAKEFDEIIVNDSIERAADELVSLLGSPAFR